MGILFAINVLPQPGDPIIIKLCPPAAAIIAARLAYSWPFTSEKSTASLLSDVKLKLPLDIIASFLPSETSIASLSVFTGYKLSPSIILASSILLKGIMAFFIPNSLAFKSIENIPFTSLTLPSNANSPSIIVLFIKSEKNNWALDDSIPKAKAKSYMLPVFFISAGAKFMVILFGGKNLSLLFIAAITLSFASLTAWSGNPTTSNFGKPSDIFTSIVIGMPSIP